MPTPTRTKPTHHLLRRTARKVARRYNAGVVPAIGSYYRAFVVPVKRGPRGRWRVELRLVTAATTSSGSKSTFRQVPPGPPPTSSGGTTFVA